MTSFTVCSTLFCSFILTDEVDIPDFATRIFFYEDPGYSTSHSGEAERAGLTMQPTHVLIFGSPRAGTPLMVASPLIALDLPLKVLIWQDRAGTVRVSYTSSAY